MFIENISMADVKKGWHFDPGPNSMLIQIVDPDNEHPTARFHFKETRKFKFLDLEDEHHPLAITDEDAKHLADALRHAFSRKMHVVVHCHAGVCRSGAVVEAGMLLGFEDTEKYRIPNLLVYHKLKKALGF